MHYTDTEAALISGLITSYLFQPAVHASVKTAYSHVLRRLQENHLTTDDLTRIQNALSFVAPMCPDDWEAHQDFMAVRLKTDTLLRAATR